MNTTGDMESLIWLTDAIEAGMACDFLDEAEIPFEIEDHSIRPEYPSFRERAGIRMEIQVRKEDMERAKDCLREKMNLFPLPEIDGDLNDKSSDDEDVLSEAIICDELSDAEAAKGALDAAGIRGTVRRMDEDGTVSYSVEVRGKDIERAVDIVNQWLLSKG